MAASFGLAPGAALNHYTMSLFGMKRLRGQRHDPTAGPAVAGAELEQAINGELA